MNYHHIRPAIFLERPNRFIARCLEGEREVTVHVKNTGRCRELLIPGAQVWLEYASGGSRKTPCDLVAVQKGELLINMDSQAPNKVAMEGLQSGKIVLPGFGLPQEVRPERTFGGSRFDFFIKNKEQEGFVEVKGVTLERDGAVFFPDAPTLRGIRHIEELEQAAAQGYAAYVLFIVQLRPVHHLSPNDETQPAFGAALRHAQTHGVQLLAYDCSVTPQSMEIAEPVPIRL